MSDQLAARRTPFLHQAIEPSASDMFARLVSCLPVCTVVLSVQCVLDFTNQSVELLGSS